MEPNYMSRVVLALALLLLMVAPAFPTVTPSNAISQPLTINPEFPASKPSAPPAKYLKPVIDPALKDPGYIVELRAKYGSLFDKVYRNAYHIKSVKSPVGVFVKLASPGALASLERMAERYGGEVAKFYSQVGWALVVLPYRNVPQFTSALEKSPLVVAAVPDRILQPAMYDAQWLLGMWDVWDNLGLDGTGVLVSVIDTGVDPDHPALPYPTYWVDYINNRTTPYDDHGHGTHVSGIILGRNVSLFNTSDYMWHAVLVGESSNFNPPVDKANLTYELNVSSVSGGNVTIEIEHLYNLYEAYYTGSFYIYFKANASIMVNFEYANASYSGWAEVASFHGNQTTPVVSKINVTVPSGAVEMYVSFIYDYILKTNGSNYDYSEWDITGWFINYVKVYPQGSPSTPLLNDTVSDPAIPANVINSTYWLRVKDEFRGMAPNASLAVAKVCSSSGCPDSAIMEAMNWSLNIGANVVSMSLGGPASSYDPLAEMADYLVDHGVVVVVAAGNEGPYYYNVSSPGISHKAITVAAATKQFTLAYFSSPGPSPADFYVKPDVAGLGYDVISSISHNGSAAPPWAATFPYVAWAGTSMATPTVSGLAALIKQAHPSWTPKMIKSAIITTADWLNTNSFMSYQYDVYKQGAGMIDPSEAITAEILPIPANIYLGTILLKATSTVTANVTIMNVAASNKTLTVSEVDLYKLNTSTYLGGATDYDSALIAPSVGDSITVAAGGNATLTITVNASALTEGVYGGHILLYDPDTGRTYKVVFGLNAAATVAIEGAVLDDETGMPMPGVSVSVYVEGETSPFYTNTTNSTGHFKVYAPPDTFVRIVASMPGYISYYSYVFSFTSDVTGYTIRLVPVPATPSVLVFIDRDAYTPETDSDMARALNNIVNTTTALGIPYKVWPAYNYSYGSPADALFNGYYKTVIYLAGGTYGPLVDPLDYYGMINFSTLYNGSILLSGGDIGWAHGNDTLMVKVAHAAYKEDMDPGTYTFDVLNSTVTATLLGADFYLSHLGTPSGGVLTPATIYEHYDWWPDNVTPANGGFPIGEYSPGNYSVIAYLGNGTERAKTIYLAFELAELNDTLQRAFVERAIALAFDRGAPQLVGALAARVNGTLVTLLSNASPSTPPGVEEDFPILYMIDLLDENNTLLASWNVTTLPFTFNLSAVATPQPGDIFYVNMTVVDIFASRLDIGHAYMIKFIAANATGVSVRSSTTATGYTPDVAGGAWVTLDTTGTASVQLVQANLSGLPPLPIPTGGYALLTIDLYLQEETPGAVNSITVTFKAPPGTDAGAVWAAQAYWFDGSTWRRVDSLSFDTHNGTITITITVTTSPSLSDLTGTPIILMFPTTIVGGVLVDSPLGGGLGTTTIAAAVAVVTGYAVLQARRKRRV